MVLRQRRSEDPSGTALKQSGSAAAYVPVAVLGACLALSGGVGLMVSAMQTPNVVAMHERYGYLIRSDDINGQRANTANGTIGGIEANLRKGWPYSLLSLGIIGIGVNAIAAAAREKKKEKAKDPEEKLYVISRALTPHDYLMTCSLTVEQEALANNALEHVISDPFGKESKRTIRALEKLAKQKFRERRQQNP